MNENVTDLPVLNGAGVSSAPVFNTTQGSAASTEEAIVSAFSPLSRGQSLSIGGLKFTATEATTAEETAEAFAGLNDGDTSKASLLGTYSGRLSGWYSGSAVSGAVTFTSTAVGSNVTDLTAQTSALVVLPSVVSSEGFSSTPPDVLVGVELIDARNLSLNDLINDSLTQINAHRSYFGAFYGRFEHNIANLSAQTENLSAALSRVQDADYGAETATLTKVQILQQAATAMLAQANAMPNVILGLLKSS
ncbi:MAG: hypothetical protein EB072_00450 [Betaproteobacteria bacterium]|nr:hypothetical protein [Betaproteobacteria bacterium]